MSAHELAVWRFGEPRTWLTPELLLAEVRDTIDKLNGRPDSTDRCLAAVDAFLADRTEENRAAARAAYLAIPETQRHYALGDMDRKDWPFQVLVTGPGEHLDGTPPGEPATREEYDDAIAYFEERAKWIAERPARVPADGPATPIAPAIHLYQRHSREPSDDPGTKALRNDFPAPVLVDGVTYPCVGHVYWALSTTDPAARAAIRDANTVYAARDRAADAPRRGWDQARNAVMTALLRAKYTQHPALARILLVTHDATLVYDDFDSGYWGDDGGRGRNWTGRLLELVRSGLRAEQAGITLPEPGTAAV
ncbi:NADAR family protein [Streptomyces caelestis]|uniref:Putative NAD-dependent protein-ADP-ribosyltransferase YbiA (DUF1768 family) n=1 Tax=Streptomyces caelestis TaxID=36816 RepID=A0A7W9LXY0_9ACTN|nr:NADAR family protein [Streptomyces caelestis]MBB5800052.1 putative NAD-dependent protein-ADP-ribosyltransferase YbiA (DUF1768 family) [Streptomyces caelestis]GGW76487.1 hypothetical protein GCM10010320_68200 [Streptomyces caelestis]